MGRHGNTLPSKSRGIDPNDTLKKEKGEAITAMRQLLCAESEDCRINFQKRITEAKSSNKISQIMAEVREKL